jgi:hypothetical protein
VNNAAPASDRYFDAVLALTLPYNMRKIILMVNGKFLLILSDLNTELEK